ELGESLDVVFKHLSSGAGPSRGEGVGSLHKECVNGIHLRLIMVGGYGLHHLGGLTITLRDISTYDGVRALHFVVHGLSNVVQQTYSLGGLLVHTQFRSYDAT